MEVITTTWQPTHPFHMISRKYQVTLKGTTLKLVFIVIKVIKLFVHCMYIVKCSERVVNADIQYSISIKDQIRLNCRSCVSDFE